MEMTLLGIVMRVRLVQSKKARFPMFVTLPPIATVASLSQSSNVDSAMPVTPLPMMTFVRTEHETNACSPRLVTLSGIVTLVRLEQASNAYAPMLVTLLGIVTLVKGWPTNALSPMVVTGRPVIVAGMTTAPPGPWYPVIVIVPLLAERKKSGQYSAITAYSRRVRLQRCSEREVVSPGGRIGDCKGSKSRLNFKSVSRTHFNAPPTVIVAWW